MIVFICSAHRGNVEENQKRARKLCKCAIIKGMTPIAPHLIYPQVLDDNDRADRLTGMKCSLNLLGCADLLWYDVTEITEGMRVEINAAIDRRIPIFPVDPGK